MLVLTTNKNRAIHLQFCLFLLHLKLYIMFVFCQMYKQSSSKHSSGLALIIEWRHADLLEMRFWISMDIKTFSLPSLMWSIQGLLKGTIRNQDIIIIIIERHISLDGFNLSDWVLGRVLGLLLQQRRKNDEKKEDSCCS